MMQLTAIAATLAFALQAAPADEPAKTPEKLENISIPQELSPALMPYLACRQSEQGVALYDDEGKLMNPRSARKDCAPLRDKARGKTVGILKDLMLGRNRKERLQVADYWLDRIDTLSGPSAG